MVSEGLRSGGLRRLVLVAALCASALVPFLRVSPAVAVVAEIGGHTYGLTPIHGVNAGALPSVQRAASRSRLRSSGVLPYDKLGQLTYHGGPVMHSVTTHVVYWDPLGEFTATTKSIVNAFFTDVAHDSGLATNVFGVGGQYGDKTGGHALYTSTFGSEGTDANAYPTSGCKVPVGGDAGPPYTHCITDKQLQEQLETYVAAEGLPRGSSQQYFVLFPHKVVTCFPGSECSNNVFCAYHSSIEGGSSNEIIYSDIPFTLLDGGHVKECQADANTEIQLPNGDTAGSNESTRYADVALKFTSHEYVEAATDPLGNAWWEPVHGQEIGDKCNFAGSGPEPGEDPFAFKPTLGGSAGSGTLYNQLIDGGQFYLQSEWDNAAKACSMTPVPVTGVGFSVSPSPAAGTPVSFEGAATDIYPGLSLRWDFGDGTEGSGLNPTHTYSSPGTKLVTLTARDELTGATGEPATHEVVVNDQPSASFTVSPNPATAGAPVAFNGGTSSDPGGSIASYAWSFGDGSSGAGSTQTHTYTTSGTYTVTLTVTGATGRTSTVSHSVAVLTFTTPTSTTPGTSKTTITPNSSFAQGQALLNQTTGELTFSESVEDAGTFSWLLTFQNGKFGVFAASNHKCKAGFVRLGGRCRPSRIVFARGRMVLALPGTFVFKVKPTASGLKALKNALKRKKGLPVTVTLTFQSARGGNPISHSQTITVRLKKR